MLHDTTLFGLRDEKKINNTRLQKCLGFEANDEDGKGSGGGTSGPGGVGAQRGIEVSKHDHIKYHL